MGDTTGQNDKVPCAKKYSSKMVEGKINEGSGDIANPVDHMHTMVEKTLHESTAKDNTTIHLIGKHAIAFDTSDELHAEHSTKDRYTKCEKIGAGAEGMVFMVKDNNLDRFVAMKFIRADRNKPGAQDSFSHMVREARTTAKLEHPGIVPVYDLDISASGEIYYSMRRIKGWSLKELINMSIAQDQPSLEIATINDRINIITRICETAAYAHSRGIIHCDINPGNIMIGAFGEVLLVDWGVADSDCDNTAPTMKGSSMFMSPEQARKENIDQRSDIYSMGVTMYQLLLLRAPINSNETDDFRTLNSEGFNLDLTDEERKLIPERLFSIVRKAMAADPSDRYQSANEMAGDLRKYQQGRSISAHQDSLPDILRRLCRKHRAKLSVIFLALLATTAALKVQSHNNGQQLQAELEKLQSEGNTSLRLSQNTAELSLKEEHLLDAQHQLMGARALDPGNNKIKAALVNTYTNQFEIALANNRWRQAHEKLLLSKNAGMSDSVYNKLNDRLTKEENMRADYIRGRIAFLMADSQSKPNNKDLQRKAIEEIISLSGPVAAEKLLQYLDHSSEVCRIIAIRALSWMDNPLILPEIKTRMMMARANESSSRVTTALIRACMVLAPDDLETFRFLFHDCQISMYTAQNPVFAQIKPQFLAYSRRLIPRILNRVNHTESTISIFEIHSLAALCELLDETDIAFTLFNKVINTVPESELAGSSYISMAFIVMRRGRYEDAVRFLDKGISILGETNHILKQRAIAYQGMGKDDLAERDIMAVLAVKPDEQAYSILATIYTNRAEWQKAIEMFDQSLMLKPSPETYYNKAHTLFKMGDHASVVSTATKALELSPDYADALSCRGNAYLKMNELEKALIDFTSVINHDPRHWSSYHYRHKVRLLMNDQEGAITDLCNLSLADILSQENLIKAEAQFKVGDSEGALSTLDELIKIAPTNSPIRDAAISQKAWILYKRHNCKEAERLYTLLLEKDPDNEEYLENRGCTRLSLQQIDKADADLRKALSINPSLRNAIQSLFVTASLLNDQTTADKMRKALVTPGQDDTNILKDLSLFIKSFRQIQKSKELLGQNLNSAVKLFNRAVWLMGTGEWDEARKDLLKAKEMAGKRELGIILARLLEVADATDNWELRINTYTELLELQPDSPKKMADLGRALVLAPDELQKPDKGIELLETAVALTEEKDLSILSMYAESLFKTGRRKDAVEIQKKVIERLPDNAPFKLKASTRYALEKMKRFKIN